jgi:hypothetical protein
MKRWLLGLCCVLLSSAALAAGPDAVRKRVQASMLVTGTIDVAPDGSVARYAVDHPEELPSQVTSLLDKTLSVWKFEPVMEDGKPVTAKAPMGVRIVAIPLGNGSYSISIAGAWFGNDAKDEKDVSQETITYKHRVQPIYPRDAVSARVAGTVYVLEKVNRDGTVDDAVAEQVDLRMIASDDQLAAWRRVLAGAALRALKQGTFNPPTAGKDVDQPYWIVRIPVDFSLSGPSAPAAVEEERYGQWRPYVPGPVQEPVWADKNKLAGSADAVPEGGSLLADTSLHLRTPLSGS